MNVLMTLREEIEKIVDTVWARGNQEGHYYGSEGVIVKEIAREELFKLSRSWALEYWKNEEKKFFDELADKLDGLFPKGKCQERGQALMLNAYANLLFRNLLKEVRKKIGEASQ